VFYDIHPLVDRSGSTLTIGAGTTLISDALTIFKPAGGTVL